MSFAIVPVGPVQGEDADSTAAAYLPRRWLEDSVDALNGQDRPENFNTTTFAPTSADANAVDVVDASTEPRHNPSAAACGTTRVIVIGGDGPGRLRSIQDEKLCRHSEFFRQLLPNNAPPSGETGGGGGAPRFREALTNTIELHFDVGMDHVMEWISRDGALPIQDIILSPTGGEVEEIRAGEVIVSALRAAHYLGCPRPFSQLEQLLSENGVDAENCISLLGLADELGACVLGRACTELALRKIDDIEASQDWKDVSADLISDGMRARLQTLRSLRAAADRHGLGEVGLPDAREYLAMLREILVGQEERLAEAEALALHSGAAKAQDILERQQGQIDSLRQYIAAQEAIFRPVLDRYGSVRELSVRKFELEHVLSDIAPGV